LFPEGEVGQLKRSLLQLQRERERLTHRGDKTSVQSEAASYEGD